MYDPEGSRPAEPVTRDSLLYGVRIHDPKGSRPAGAYEIPKVHILSHMYVYTPHKI